MKKALILALFLLPSVAFASFNADLHYGSKGDDVVALQEFLTDQGVYTGAISGNFYSLTLAGVRKYQKAQGITPVSGYVGRITRGVINAQLASIAPDSEGNATIVPAPTPAANVAPAGTSASTTPDVSHATISVDVKVNNSDSMVALNRDGCIVSGVKTCAHASVTWTSPGGDPCGITADPYIGWAGNYGTSGGKEGVFSLGTTTVTLQCGTITDSVDVLVI